MPSFAAFEDLADSLPIRRSARTPLRAEQEVGTASWVARGRARVERLCLRRDDADRPGISSVRRGAITHAWSATCRPPLGSYAHSPVTILETRPHVAGHVHLPRRHVYADESLLSKGIVESA
jgi:hypothetical protein